MQFCIFIIFLSLLFPDAEDCEKLVWLHTWMTVTIPPSLVMEESVAGSFPVHQKEEDMLVAMKSKTGQNAQYCTELEPRLMEHGYCSLLGIPLMLKYSCSIL
jgi:hypothetical protein